MRTDSTFPTLPWNTDPVENPDTKTEPKGDRNEEVEPKKKD